MPFIATPRNETFVGRLGAEADIREIEDDVTCSLGIYAELVLSWLLSPVVGSKDLLSASYMHQTVLE